MKSICSILKTRTIQAKVDGLVQIPCVERNTMRAVKAINAARLALKCTRTNHKVSLDNVIKTMFQTGRDMQSVYKETSLEELKAIHILLIVYRLYHNTPLNLGI